MNRSTKLMTTVTLAFALALITLAAGGCNTTKGAGRDLKAAGQGIENSAERNGAN